MPHPFAKMWDAGTPVKPSLADRIKLLVRGNAQLRKKLVETIRMLERDVRRLNATLSTYEGMQKSLENDIRAALREGQEDRARALANALAAVGRYKRVVHLMKLCFELIAARLKAVLVVGDVVSHLGPLFKMLKIVGPMVSKFMPGLESSLYQVEEVLDGLMSETDMVFEAAVPVALESKEARDILEAAKLSVEHEADLGLPDLPEPDLLGQAGLRQRAKKAGGEIL